jgi:hypothetical protein
MELFFKSPVSFPVRAIHSVAERGPAFAEVSAFAEASADRPKGGEIENGMAWSCFAL